MKSKGGGKKEKRGEASGSAVCVCTVCVQCVYSVCTECVCVCVGVGVGVGVCMCEIKKGYREATDPLRETVRYLLKTRGEVIWVKVKNSTGTGSDSYAPQHHGFIKSHIKLWPRSWRKTDHNMSWILLRPSRSLFPHCCLLEGLCKS